MTENVARALLKISQFERETEHFLTPVRILVVGSGGREHALVWKLAQGAAPVQLYAAPGNPGIARWATCLPIPAHEIDALASTAQSLRIDLTVVGPEAPLAAGIAEAFAARGLRLFGPSAQAAQLEASKAFAKRLMRRYGIPTADFEVFSDPAQARSYVRCRGPVVVKADGLAAGKGVVVAADGKEAERAIEAMMVRGIFGSSGARVVIEEYLTGREVSVLALVGPGGVTPLLPAQDYKRALDGDRGPNTGGMGAVAPAGASPAVVGEIVERIVKPTVAAMAAEGRPYAGVLYAGVMLTGDGPRVLEFNCRFGDPEAQVILPLLDSPLAEVLLDTLDGRAPQLRWAPRAAACVVLASRGYPGAFDRGAPITGLERLPAGVEVFHAGTALRDGRLVTAGGRVLNVVGVGSDLPEAVARVYDGVARIHFQGMRWRTDIGRAATQAAAGR